MSATHEFLGKYDENRTRIRSTEELSHHKFFHNLSFFSEAPFIIFASVFLALGLAAIASTGGFGHDFGGLVSATQSFLGPYNLGVCITGAMVSGFAAAGLTLSTAVGNRFFSESTAIPIYNQTYPRNQPSALSFD